MECIAKTGLVQMTRLNTLSLDLCLVVLTLIYFAFWCKGLASFFWSDHGVQVLVPRSSFSHVSLNFWDCVDTARPTMSFSGWYALPLSSSSSDLPSSSSFDYAGKAGKHMLAASG